MAEALVSFIRMHLLTLRPGSDMLRLRRRQSRKSTRALLLVFFCVAVWLLRTHDLVAEVVPIHASRGSKSVPVALVGSDAPEESLLSFAANGPLLDSWLPCSVGGGSCNCTGTMLYGTVFGHAVREVNVDGEAPCTAEALGAPSSYKDLHMCWCLRGVRWDDGVRKGLAAMVRQGLIPRIEIASQEPADCGADSDGLWYGCLVMNRRWDTTWMAEALLRQLPPEEQLDMAFKKLDDCHRLAPASSLRVLGLRSGQYADVPEVPVSSARACSVVYEPHKGPTWTANPSKLYCAVQPGTCTTTPCECRRLLDRKLDLVTPQGRRCWACAQPGQEGLFRVNALAERMEGGGSSWWPPHGIHCPPILWFFMDWKAVVRSCPILSGYLLLLLACLVPRRIEELTGGSLPWTRVMPLFGPPLKRGEVWRFFTFTLFHVQFMDLFHNVLTLVDALDVEATPSIILGDGSNLKCGFGVKQNFMCYPSIGIGSYHTLGVAIISSMIGGMGSMCINFKAVITGASALGFGLSGAIVALYALYAGAELDSVLNVQRSFQDWVWLRLIFVGFHIIMEWVRSFSQRDAAGLFAHTAAFAAGFAYVLYFLPPMGDGSLLPSERPYVVPCTHNVNEGEFATAQVPECVRLFSQLHEYRIEKVQECALLLFMVSILFTVLNVLVLQRRVKSDEAMLLAGCEVSAICCKGKRAYGGDTDSTSYYEGKEIIIWCQVVQITNIKIPEEYGIWESLMEVHCLGSDPQRLSPFMVDADAEASVSTRSVSAQPGTQLQFQENAFLPCRFSKRSFLQFVLKEKTAVGDVAIANASIPLPQALRMDANGASKQWVKLRAIGSSSLDTSRAAIQLIIRCLQREDLQMLRERVKRTIDHDRMMLLHLDQQLAEQLDAETGNADQSND